MLKITEFIWISRIVLEFLDYSLKNNPGFKKKLIEEYFGPWRFKVTGLIGFLYQIPGFLQFQYFFGIPGFKKKLFIEFFSVNLRNKRTPGFLQ